MLEGPIGITECGIDDDTHDCGLAASCEVRGNWQLINRAIISALEAVSLADMAARPSDSLVSLRAGVEADR